MRMLPFRGVDQSNRLKTRTLSTQAQDQPSDTAEEQKTKDSSKPKSDPLRLSWFEKAQQEIRYAREHAAKYSGPQRERRRVSEDIEATKKKWAQDGPKRKPAKDTAKTEKPRPAEEEIAKMTPAQREAYEAALAKEQEEQDRINATPLMPMGSTETKWDQRLSAAKDRLRQTWLWGGLRKLKRGVMQSDNPVAQKIRETKDNIGDGLQDIADFYGTTQHPVVSKARGIVDNVTGVTETGWAIGEIRRVDPGFDIQLFLEDMEEYMIPLVTESFLRADMSVLQSVTEEQAARVVFASCREREVQGLYWDPRILNIDHVEFQGATVEVDVPYITLTFVCQHVHCIKDAKGKIVEGHETEVKSVYYVWKVRRDFENPDFDWKIVDLQLQRVYSLVG